VSYVTDVKLTDTGCIQESQCECAAGVGPSAHCKHVRAVLFSMHQFTVNGKLNLKMTCKGGISSTVCRMSSDPGDAVGQTGRRVPPQH